MSDSRKVSRREFVTSAMSVAAISALPSPPALAGMNQPSSPSAARQGGAVALTDSPSWKDQGIENLAKSPYAKLHDIPVRAVTIPSGFWASRREINVTRSIPTMHDLLEANGRMNNFRRLVGKSNAVQIGPVFSDSDPYKWIEAVGFALQTGDHPDLRASTDKMIDEIIAVQEPSGYLNTYYQNDRIPDRMTPQTQSTGAMSSIASDICCRARSPTTAARVTANFWMPGSASSTIF